jgi:hypothetical protein
LADSTAPCSCSQTVALKHELAETRAKLAMALAANAAMAEQLDRLKCTPSPLASEPSRVLSPGAAIQADAGRVADSVPTPAHPGIIEKGARETVLTAANVQRAIAAMGPDSAHSEAPVRASDWLRELEEEGRS